MKKTDTLLMGAYELFAQLTILSMLIEQSVWTLEELCNASPKVDLSRIKVAQSGL